MQRTSAIVRLLALSLSLLALTAWSPDASAQCGGRWLTSPGQTPATFDGPVLSLAVLPSGDLIAGGFFTSAGGLPANNIARWDGTIWAPLASGADGPVFALTALPSGELVAGGGFSSAGGVAVHNIAQWNGASWSALGAGTNDWIYALTVTPEGDLVAGGLFTTAGGVPANNIARWDGSSWAALGPGLAGSVLALLQLPSGDLVAGGFFTSAGGVAAGNLARWDGAAWSTLGSGVNNAVRALAALPTGELFAGGSFSLAGGVRADCIARWDGAAWGPLGWGMGGWWPTTPFVSALAAMPDGSLVAGGSFRSAGNATASNIARWDGLTWTQLGSGISGQVDALAVLPSGELVAGGFFTTAGGAPSGYWARWTDTGIPWVAQQPIAQSTAVNGAASFTVTPASGYDFSGPLTFQWRRNGQPLADGVTPNGTVIAGATTATLSLSNLSPLDAGSITAAISNACGSAASTAARLTVGSSACPGDANADGAINTDDLMLLLGNFTAPTPPGTLGDVNGDGTVNFLDLAVVLAAFGSAC